MKKALRLSDTSGLHHYIDGIRHDGPCSGLEGNCSGLEGDCSGLRGDCSDLRGNCDDCELTDEEREAGVVIRSLIDETPRPEGGSEQPQGAAA